MIKVNTQELSENELAKMLKEEVEKRKAIYAKNAQFLKEKFQNQLSPKETTNNLYFFAKKIGKYLQRKGFYRFVSFVKTYINIQPHYYIYTLQDFTVFNEDDFIDNAYNIILCRPPTIQERDYYLLELRSGIMSKSQIVLSLYYSKEAKDKKIKILGAKKRFIIFTIFKIPFIGYMAKFLYALLTLPKLMIKLNHLQYTLEQTEQKLEQKADKSQIEMPDIPDSMEIIAYDFLSDATQKLSMQEEELSSIKQKDIFYSLFENAFYNHEVVLKKQQIYLNHIPHTNSHETPHLDIGCGRGELLTLLKQNNYEAIGIDINELEVTHLKQIGFDVHHSDMINFLKTTPLAFSSISALQVIEHIDYATLKEFITLAYKKIAQNGVIILETIYPHSKVAFNSFYMDETHQRPLPPELVAFLLQYAGFKNLFFLYSSPMPPEFRSKNDNRINYHDYAVIGYKK